MSFSMRSRIPLVAAGVLVLVALVTFLILDQTGGPASPSSLPVIQIGQVDPGQAQPDATGEAGTPTGGPDTTSVPAGTDGTGGAGSGTAGPSDTGTTGTNGATGTTGTTPTTQGGTATTGGAGPTTTTTVRSPTTGTTLHETVHGGVRTGGPTTTGVGGGGGSGTASSTTTTGHH
jgi:hypothetical protein